MRDDSSLDNPAHSGSPRPTPQTKRSKADLFQISAKYKTFLTKKEAQTIPVNIRSQKSVQINLKSQASNVSEQQRISEDTNYCYAQQMVDNLYPEQFKFTIDNPLISMNDAEFKPFTKIQVFDLYNTYKSLAVLTVFSLLNQGMSKLDIAAQEKVGVDHLNLKKGLIEERAVNIPLLKEVFMLVTGSDDLSSTVSWPQYITIMTIVLPYDLKDRFKNLLAIIDPDSKSTFT